MGEMVANPHAGIEARSALPFLQPEGATWTLSLVSEHFESLCLECTSPLLQACSQP